MSKENPIHPAFTYVAGMATGIVLTLLSIFIQHVGKPDRLVRVQVVQFVPNDSAMSCGASGYTVVSLPDQQRVRLCGVRGIPGEAYTERASTLEINGAVIPE